MASDRTGEPATRREKAGSSEHALTRLLLATRATTLSGRICVEHAIAEPKQWRSLQRWIGRREYYAETHLAVAGLVFDRAARR